MLLYCTRKVALNARPHFKEVQICDDYDWTCVDWTNNGPNTWTACFNSFSHKSLSRRNTYSMRQRDFRHNPSVIETQLSTGAKWPNWLFMRSSWNDSSPSLMMLRKRNFDFFVLILCITSLSWIQRKWACKFFRTERVYLKKIIVLQSSALDCSYFRLMRKRFLQDFSENYKLLP